MYHTLSICDYANEPCAFAAVTNLSYSALLCRLGSQILSLGMHGMLKSVGGAMNQNVETINLDSTAYEAAKKMRDRKVSSLVVVDGKNGKPAGIVTERDMARRVCAEGASSKGIRIQNVMSAPLVTIDPNSSIEVAADSMIHNKVRHLLVTDKDGKALGIITPTDFGKVLSEKIDMDEVNTLILKAVQEESAYIS